ncbi:hypothetical protein TNCV_2337941 [Trichonephila clavipes]|nr:hypothetical protein TNCV_2337941 [Trichonephila clavipes]
MVLKANDRRTSSPCHDEFRGPRSDCVRQESANHGSLFKRLKPFRLPAEDSMRITLSGTFHLITEKNTNPILVVSTTDVFSSAISGLSC